LQWYSWRGFEPISNFPILVRFPVRIFGNCQAHRIDHPEIESLLANGSTQRFIAQRYHTTEANLHNWLKKNGMKMPKAQTSS